MRTDNDHNSSGFDADTNTGRSADYDALTELFLGGADEIGPPEHSEPRHVSAFDAPSLTLVRDGNEGAAASSTSDQDKPARIESIAPIEIEALILGHLPIMAGPWATQYAASLCRMRADPVAFVRLSAGTLSVELLDPELRAPSWEERTDDVEAAINTAIVRAGRVVVRVDALDEPDVAQSPRAHRVTLLTGADEAALVGAYQTLKSLPARSGLVEADDEPRLRFAIMGATDEEADRAAKKLHQAAQAFLSETIAEAPRVGQMGPTPSIKLFQGETTLKAEELLDQIARAIALKTTPGARPKEQGNRPAAREVSTGERPDRRAIWDHSERVCEHKGGARRDIGAASFLQPVSDEASVLLHAAPDSARGGAALVTHLQGLRVLPARCPFEESVELAYDPAGRLHLCAHGKQGCLQALEVVRTWARQHAALLALIQNDAHIDAEADPVLHIFTGVPAPARRLLDSPLRVHLLQKIELAGQTGWLCTDLN